MKKHPIFWLLVASALVLIITPCGGMRWINPLGALSNIDRQILTQLRIPRILSAYLAGCALALGGHGP